MKTISTKNLIIICVVALLLLSGILYFVRGLRTAAIPAPGNDLENLGGANATSTDGLQGDAAARDVVTNFGAQLPKVSLLSPDSAASMEEFYGPFVSPELLSEWQNDHSKAPGRQTSSPWPDHIEIGDVEKVQAGYIVRGQIIYMTSNELEHGGNAGVQDVTITLSNSGGKLLITDFVAGQFGRGGAS